MAVRLVVVLLESAFVELTSAERAGKVLRVKLLLHRRHAASGNWLLTRGAQCSTTRMVVLLAIAPSFVLVKGAAGE